MTHLTNNNYKIYGDFPLTIEANKHKRLEILLDWLRKEKSLLEEAMLKHGAIRFRNFDVSRVTLSLTDSLYITETMAKCFL